MTTPRARLLAVLAALLLIATPACAEEVATNPLDELLIAIDATRAVPTGRYSTTSPRQSALGEYDADGVRLMAAACPDIQPPCPESRLIGRLAYVRSSSLPAIGASTGWLTVPLDELGPLENRSPGLADEVAALGGAPPPGIGPTLAALRTSRRAPRMDTGPLRAELDLTDLDRLSPRDQDAVVAWAALWARRGGERNVTADVSITSDGHVEMVVFDDGQALRPGRSDRGDHPPDHRVDPAPLRSTGHLITQRPVRHGDWAAGEYLGWLTPGADRFRR